MNLILKRFTEQKYYYRQLLKKKKTETSNILQVNKWLKKSKNILKIIPTKENSNINIW